MSSEALSGKAMFPRAVRRTSGDRLREALLAVAGGRAMVLHHEERAWASVTFAGARHRLVLAFEGEDGVEAGETFIALLPDHEFAIPRLLVADASVTAITHALLPRPRLTVECELLLLDEG